MNFYILLISFSLSALLMPIIQNLFIRLNKLDLINDRSSHKALATRTGGVSVFLTIFIISTYYYLNGEEPYDFSILVPLSMMFVIGVYDDFYNADFKLKFFIQIIVAKMIIDQGFIIDDFNGLLGLNEIPRIFSQLFTIFVFLIIVNSINFIDGIDGLAITETIKVLLIFEYLHLGNSKLFIVSVVCILSLLPLYFFNFKKNNKVFLGDAGSLFLGTLISIYCFYFLGSDYNLEIRFNKPLLSILILFYPLTDLLRVFIIRLRNKKSPFQPDNKHLHHVLLRKGLSHWKISIILPFGFLLVASLIVYIFKI